VCKLEPVIGGWGLVALVAWRGLRESSVLQRIYSSLVDAMNEDSTTVFWYCVTVEKRSGVANCVTLSPSVCMKPAQFFPSLEEDEVRLPLGELFFSMAVDAL